MTTSRIVRGTKVRVFLYICAILFITGIIACYNNARVKLDETQKSYDLCKQETDNLSSQVQVIYDYKTRIEKSLKTEKADHQRTKSEFDAKLNEEILRNEKVSSDSKLRFSTLQQHYNLLQTAHDDFKDECSKIQRQQLDEINTLQAHLSEVQEQFKKSDVDKLNNLEHLKNQNEILRNEKTKLEHIISEQKENNLKREDPPVSKRTETSSTQFSKQVPVGNSKYIIRENFEQKNVGDIPANAQDVDAQNLIETNQENAVKNVLANPPINVKSSTPNSLSKKGISKPSINAAIPLNIPTATPETNKKSTSKGMKKTNEDILPIPYSKKLPAGVVPVQPFDESKHEKTDLINNNNRYHLEEPKKDSKIVNVLMKDNDFNEMVGDKDTAHEIFDSPLDGRDTGIGKVDELKKHIDALGDENQNVLDYDLQEQEDDDDGNPLGDKDPAIRN